MAYAVYSRENVFQTVDWSKLKKKNTSAKCGRCRYQIPAGSRTGRQLDGACSFLEQEGISRIRVLGGDMELVRQRPCPLFKAGKHKGRKGSFGEKII